MYERYIKEDIALLYSFELLQGKIISLVILETLSITVVDGEDKGQTGLEFVGLATELIKSIDLDIISLAEIHIQINHMHFVLLEEKLGSNNHFSSKCFIVTLCFLVTL
ncbi:hypothetical protein ACJX0J_007751, partial [Zea mays]